MKPVETLISLKHISAGYEGRAVVQDVSIDITNNDVIAFIGPNGGGKTTILKVLLGILSPMEGEVKRKSGLKIGYLPQVNDIDFSFPISVMDVVLSGMQSGMRLWPSKEARKRAEELLEFAHLDHLKGRAIGDLSGGQRQRVFLCRAIMGEPHLLILDEPVTYMDKVAETNLYQLLPKLAGRMAIILVSHDIGTVSSFVKTIACINKTLHYHATNKISESMLSIYECPVEIVSHGAIPHRVLLNHLHK